MVGQITMYNSVSPSSAQPLARMTTQMGLVKACEVDFDLHSIVF